MIYITFSFSNFVSCPVGICILENLKIKIVGVPKEIISHVMMMGQRHRDSFTDHLVMKIGETELEKKRKMMATGERQAKVGVSFF